jgi:hypothetical protein
MLIAMIGKLGIDLASHNPPRAGPERHRTE